MTSIIFQKPVKKDSASGTLTLILLLMTIISTRVTPFGIGTLYSARDTLQFGLLT